MPTQTQTPIQTSPGNVALPPALAHALIEFQLMPEFRARSASQREALTRWVEEAPEPGDQRERIADLLDHLAATAK